MLYLYSCTVLSLCIKDAAEGSRSAQPTARLLHIHGLHAGASSERLRVWSEHFLPHLLPEESKLWARCKCTVHMTEWTVVKLHHTASINLLVCNAQLIWPSIVDWFLLLSYLIDRCVSRQGIRRLVGLLVTSWTWAASCRLRACPWERLFVQEPGACSSSSSLSCSF